MNDYIFLWIALLGLGLAILYYRSVYYPCLYQNTREFWARIDSESFDTYSYQTVDSPFIKKTVKHDELVNARRNSSVSLDLEKAMLTDQIILDEVQANYQGV